MQHPGAERWHAALATVLILITCVASTSWAGVTDPTLSITPPALAMPAAGVPYNDPAFGTSSLRIANARPEYSELAAWNADGTLLMTNSSEIRDAQTLQVIHTIDYAFPDWGTAIRWSPTDPHVLYYVDNNDSFCSGAVLLRYRLIPGTPWTRVRELVRCFPEYRKFRKDESWEEMSDDGRYIGLVAEKVASNSWGWVGEAFVYDVVNNVKHTPLTLPIDPTYGPRTSDHIAMSPSGRYALMWWSSGTARYQGTESYDLEMNYVGKVHTGNTPHSTLTMDANGNDWMVADNASNAYVLMGNHYIVKAKIPIGVIYDANGNLDAAATVSSGSTVALLQLDWFHNMHISGTNRQAPGWVVASTYSTQEGLDNGWQPFEDEVFRVFLDSTPGAPHVDRVAHHRSHYSSLSGRDACTGQSNYFAQPHATVSPNGRQIIFGTNWGRICDTSDPVDAILLTLPGSGADTTPPAAIRDLRSP